MKFTNVNNLPQGIVNAVERINQQYSKGDADFSCSGLNTPPQIAWLTRAYNESLTSDVSDEIWKLFGSAMHNILDQSSEVSVEKLAEFRKNQLNDIRSIMNDYNVNRDGEIIDVLSWKEPKRSSSLITEERFYGKVGTYTISGKPDWYRTDTKRIEDYKVTSVWKILKNDYSDWEAQLNIYRWLMVINGYEVKELQINALLKDWKKYESSRNEKYPKFSVMTIPIKMWDILDTVQYVLDKVRLHTDARKIGSVSEMAKKFPCTAEQKWSSPTTYAVKKVGNKKASFVFDNIEDADTKCNQLGSAYQVETRAGIDKRCVEFCAVRDYCGQYAEEHNKQTVNMPKDNLGEWSDKADNDFHSSVITTKSETIKEAKEVYTNLKNAAESSLASLQTDGERITGGITDKIETNDGLAKSAEEFIKENNVKLPVKEAVKLAKPDSVKNLLDDLGI